jgi:hypothetical protein
MYNCSNIPAACKSQSYVWPCLFISVVLNITQVIWMNILKKKLKELRGDIYFQSLAEEINGIVIPEAEIVEEGI